MAMQYYGIHSIDDLRSSVQTAFGPGADHLKEYSKQTKARAATDAAQMRSPEESPSPGGEDETHCCFVTHPPQVWVDGKLGRSPSDGSGEAGGLPPGVDPITHAARGFGDELKRTKAMRSLLGGGGGAR